MGKLSRNKGKVGERELRDKLREAGFSTAIRGQQYCGSPNSPDVICPELPTIHFECKRCERGNIYEWIAQATRDAGDKMPVVAHRRNSAEWLAILKLDDLTTILCHSDLVDMTKEPYGEEIKDA